ncbi:MAG TPA: alpha-L-fucosidase [Fimbriimonadaceae bacterium]|nr:alpha-L-fucosidase [Fimbriimonadaceae bacterium]
MTPKLGLAAAILITLFANTAVAQQPYNKRLQWWGDARFGMFIHWGPVSLKETEISWSRANTNPKCPNAGPISAEEYDNLYKRFDPVKFDAKEWVRIAKEAGMKYMVLTAKHCDGFLLWDSKVSDYNIMHTPFKRDVCGELAKACHEAGMKIGWYFSPMDWKDPDCRNANNAEFVKRMQGEIRELLTNYGRIDVMWFDCDGGTVPWDQETTYAMVKKLQPNIVIDNRLDLGPTGNAGSPSGVGPHADYFTPEQWIGGYDDQHPWESCMTMSKKGQWSWAGHADGVKPFNSFIDMLAGCAGGDGNVLLDVGPMPNGEIAPEQVASLKEIGAWYAKYGETIHGTRGGPFKPGPWGTSTRKGKTVYLHIRNWDGDSLKLPLLPAKIVRSRMLTGGKVTVTSAADGFNIVVPEKDRKWDTIIALDLDRPALGIPAVAVPPVPSLTTGAKAIASNVFQNSPEYLPSKAVDGNPDTRWATDSGTHQAWLEVDLGKPATLARAVIVQAFPELKRVRKFNIEYWAGGEWKVCYRGTDLGAKLDVKLPKVTAQKVRLNITEATDGPTIWEFKLFAPTP